MGAPGGKGDAWASCAHLPRPRRAGQRLPPWTCCPLRRWVPLPSWSQEDGFCAGPRGPALPQLPRLHLLEVTCSRSQVRVVDSDRFYLDPWGCVNIHRRSPCSFADGAVVAPLGHCWSCIWALAGLVLCPGLGWTAAEIQRQTQTPLVASSARAGRSAGSPPGLTRESPPARGQAHRGWVESSPRAGALRRCPPLDSCIPQLLARRGLSAGGGPGGCRGHVGEGPRRLPTSRGGKSVWR